MPPRIVPRLRVVRGSLGRGISASRGEGGGQRGDGVGSAGVSKTVAPGSGNGDLIAAAAKSLRDGCVGAGSIENNVSGDAAGERAVLVNVAHAAQVALTFFADVAKDDERHRKLDASVAERSYHGQHSGHSGRVVARARSFKTVTVEDRMEQECRRERQCQCAPRGE